MLGGILLRGGVFLSQKLPRIIFIYFRQFKDIFDPFYFKKEAFNIDLDFILKGIGEKFLINLSQI